MLVPEREAAGALPSINKGLVEVGGWVAFDVGESGQITLVVGDGEEVFMVFDGSEESKEVLFELKADKFFGAEIAVGSWSRRMFSVPGLRDSLCEEVDPATVGRRKGKC